MNSDDFKTIPLIAAEIISDRLDRTIKRLWIVIILLIVLLVGSNGMWLYYNSQFEYFETTQEVKQEADSGANYFVGVDSYGNTDSKDNNER